MKYIWLFAAGVPIRIENVMASVEREGVLKNQAVPMFLAQHPQEKVSLLKWVPRDSRPPCSREDGWSH